MWAVTHVLRSSVLDLLIRLAVLVTLLVLAGLIFQAIGTARDARRFPPPGRLVDIGGHRLHIYRMGEGTPAVVMDSGFPASSLSWTFVQPAVARFTHACSYDRAGLGWSDASTYPGDVVGLVLVDPIHPSEWLQMTDASARKLAGAIRLSRYGALLARMGIARLISALVRLGTPGLARTSVSLLTGGTMAEAERRIAPLGKLPLELRPIIAALWTQPKFFDAIASQAESLPQSAAQVAATGDYGDIPLVVLSASSSSPSDIKGHEALAHLSSQGKHVVASKSGHWIQLDEPDLVIESIREVVELVGRRSPK